MKVFQKTHNWWRKRRWYHKLLLIILVLVIGFGIYRVVNPPDPLAKYELAQVTQETITDYVSETGNVTVAGVTPIYSTTTGIIEEVLVANDQLVSKGDVLFKVVSTASLQERQSALANYMAAKNQLESAETTKLSLQAQLFGRWDSFKNLAESDEYENPDGSVKNETRDQAGFLISQREWQAAEAAYAKQEQVVSQARVAMSAAWQAYQATQDSKVTALLDGTVANLSITTGDLVQAAGVSTPSPALLLSAIDSPTIVKLSVGETDAVKLVPGQEASVKLDALAGVELKALVERVDSVATPTQGVVNYNVYVRVDDPDQVVRAGMTADVDIIVSTRENVLVVPSVAVKPYEGGRAVRVLNDKNQVEYKSVETGVRSNDKTEIVSGVELGQEVVVAVVGEGASGPGLFGR